MWVGSREKANEVLLKDPGLLSETTRNSVGYPGGHNEGYPDTFKMCFKAFYDYIKTGKTEGTGFATFADGHHEILLCDAIVKSHRQGNWVTI